MEYIGKYKIVEVLGQGAMGIVYKAVDPDIDREVAIKTINFGPQIEEGNEELVKRFMREAQSAGKLTHPHIVTIYEVGSDGDMTYIVMQYVEGQSLQKLIAKGKTFSHEEIVRLFTQISSALDTAHAKGVIHRDIKPGNILIDQAGDAHIVDFGVAHVETSTMTTTGMTLGTPSYMSPEQVMGRKADSRSDVFSLGVVLFEMITGKRPFHAENVTTLIYKIINEEPPAMSTIRHDIPGLYEPIVLKALAKKQEDRYPNCWEIAMALAGEGQEGGTQFMDSRVLFEARPSRGKKRILLAVLAGVSAVAVIAVVLILVGSEQKPFPPARGGAPPQNVQVKTPQLDKPAEVPDKPAEVPDKPADETERPVEKPEKPAEKPEASALELSLKEIQSRLDAGEYAAAQSMGEKLLADYPGDSGLLDLVERAKLGLSEEMALKKTEEAAQKAQEVSRRVDNGIAAYNRGSYSETVTLMKEVLTIDGENQPAKRYIGLADREISRADILQLLERQKNSEETKNLEALLMDMGNVSVSEQRRESATLLFNFYENIKSLISDISIDFRDSRHASIRFSNMVTAVYKKNKQKTVVFEGLKTWDLEKQGNLWKVVSLKK
jgi:serine/threonine protein kinase